MDHIKVSIITVVYNGVNTIERTIKSVLEQTYCNIEYIIIDGGSLDGTLAIVECYQNKVIHVISEPDQGIYDAINKGIILATGDLIGIINSDDWYEKEAVLTMVNTYRQNPNCFVFHGLLRHVDLLGGMSKITGHQHQFLKYGMIEHPTCFVRKEVYQHIMFNPNYKAAGDYEFMLLVLEHKFAFCFVNQIIANFSAGGISNSFIGAKETLAIQKKHHLISNLKRFVLIIYFWLKK